mmetsp:Transcript_35473/g.53339  ORF Transcript_35473/g.53339 Transcript_35473/m.53339 type:complete len:204 (+) Transcript_35473:441-1052(+)
MEGLQARSFQHEAPPISVGTPFLSQTRVKERPTRKWTRRRKMSFRTEGAPWLCCDHGSSKMPPNSKTRLPSRDEQKLSNSPLHYTCVETVTASPGTNAGRTTSGDACCPMFSWFCVKEILHTHDELGCVLRSLDGRSSLGKSILLLGLLRICKEVVVVPAGAITAIVHSAFSRSFGMLVSYHRFAACWLGCGRPCQLDLVYKP